MKLFSQPFDTQLGEYLKELLNSEQYDTLNVVVAFAKNSGVLRLKDSLERFREKGGEINVFVGIDLNGTSAEALVNLLSIVTSLHVIHDENGQTFHTKLFNFVGTKQASLVVGSNNLTAGGLWTNYESSIQLSLDLAKPEFQVMQQSVDNYLSKLSSNTETVKQIKSRADIDELEANGYVEKEVRSKVHTKKKSGNRENRKSSFGSSKRAPLPGLSTFSKTVEGIVVSGDATVDNPDLSSLIDASDFTEATLWLETRKMTGGSRNILDLSKTSLLLSGTVAGTEYAHSDKKYMRGAVEFFGLDPDDTDVEKEIVINFDGVDYGGNIIKFPEGEKANGTWRVQIRGVSAAGKRITSTFREKANGGHYLPEKIVSFTRLNPNYYFLSVFDGGELSNFMKASSITAYNGRTDQAKLLGILEGR
ncbi:MULTISPECIES: phospholipase D family protein [unclassified Corynebacterium]|uniref:phospholipase D family protein n=1 Tax=unclassified Corynebacterium TaxID=2624378 RepID=UPI0008A11F05|nr:MULTISPECIES: phospholipase D family protein [unclassified Corynebacterium]OFP32275.1 hypothetical protein HMPREF2993_05590 [Corynebacterium sp. HMSC068G04]OHO53521.1 hypothetical protein HMPREF2635_09340 [Corynebacterium sp. HMSC035E02]